MKQELFADNIALFRNCFGTFHDAIIYEVRLGLFNRITRYSKVSITLDVPICNLETQQRSRHWLNLIIDIEGVEKFVVRKESHYGISVVSNLEIGFFDDKVFFDFAAYEGNFNSKDDFEKSFNQKEVAFVVVGQRCFWHTSSSSQEDVS